ncbi:MAG: hypothetical protein LAO56_13795 [Acidobacteriia bacterium]|nr:hypothetical protein [Terriglobia bacterium]
MNVESPWNIYRTRFLVRARQLTEPLLFTDALGREQSGLPGDYLVESSPGFHRITPRAIFEDIYVPLAPSQPYSTPAPRASTNSPSSAVDGWSARASTTDSTRATAWSG